MEKTYDPHSIEETWYQRWEDEGYFAAHGDGDPYCIVIPPPNVTGSLHMGHAFPAHYYGCAEFVTNACPEKTRLWQVGY